MLIKCSNFWGLLIIIASLLEYFMSLLVLCHSSLGKVSLSIREVCSSKHLMLWKLLCVMLLYFVCLTNHYQLVWYVMHQIIVLVLCWSNSRSPQGSGILLNISVSISVRLSAIILQLTGSLLRSVFRWLVGATFLLVLNSLSWPTMLL